MDRYIVCRWDVQYSDGRMFVVLWGGICGSHLAPSLSLSVSVSLSLSDPSSASHLTLSEKIRCRNWKNGKMSKMSQNDETRGLGQLYSTECVCLSKV